jgi:hypothetical protein
MTSEITDDPALWLPTSDVPGEEVLTDLWIHRHYPNQIYSVDGGKTFYDITEPVLGDGSPRIYNSKESNSA